MSSLKRKLSYLLLGQQGGENRVKIIELLKDRPYNINQLADELELNYRTIKHHVGVMVENDILIPSKGGDYGKVYFLNERLENNIEVYEDVLSKFESITATPVLFQNILKRSEAAIILADEEGNVLFWNKGAEDIFGYSKKEVLGKELDIFEKEGFIEDIFDGVDERGKVVRETEIKSKSGENKYIELVNQSILDDDEEFLGYSIVAIDITKRREVEKEKEKQYNVLQAIMENTESQLVYFDKDFNFVHVNSAYTEASGYSKEELIGKNHFELFPNEENEKIFEMVRESGKPVTYTDKPFEFPDDPERGTTYWNWTLSPVKTDQGEVQGFVLSLIETTDRVEFERELKEKNERIEFLNSFIESIKDVNQELVKNDDFVEVIQKAPSILLGTNKFTNITISMFDDEGIMRPISNKGSHTLGSWEITKDGEGEDAPGCIKESLEKKGEVIVEEPKSYCETCPVSHSIQDHQTVVIPMIDEDSIIGTIRACYEPDLEIDERTLELLYEVADDLVYAKNKNM
ncbi:MAG: PAS domain S-box protein [Candidatus Saliniplasma sp.]